MIKAKIIRRILAQEESERNDFPNMEKNRDVTTNIKIEIKNETLFMVNLLNIGYSIL